MKIENRNNIDLLNPIAQKSDWVFIFHLSSFKFIFIAFFFLLSTFSLAQQIGLEKNWSESHNDKFTNVSQNFNRSFLKGETFRDSIIYDTIGGFVFYLPQFIHSKYDYQGNVVSEVLFSNNDSILINGNYVKFFSNVLFRMNSFNNNVIIAGGFADFINVPNSFDNYVFCFDTMSNILFFTYLNLYPLSEPKGIYDTKVMVNGEIYVVGWISGGSNSDSYMSKLDIDGNLLYTKRYFIPNYQASYKVTQLSSGEFLLCGRSGLKAMFMKINPITGDTISFTSKTLPIPSANLSQLDVKYLEERSNNTYLAMVYDGGGQGFICYLDTNFNLLHSHLANGNYDNFFRVNDNEYIGYYSNDPSSSIPSSLTTPTIYSFDSLGVENWSLTLPIPNYCTFVPDGNGGLMGAGSAPGVGAGNQSDFYLCRIDSVGYPAAPICHNPPTIQSIQNDFGANLSNIILSNTSTENIQYSNVLVSNWYFQDGTTLFGDTIYKIIPAACPTSFWAMLVVTDGVGCTDTLTIDVCTGQILPNPEWPIRDTTVAIAEKNYKGVVIKRPKIYPNPTNGEITIELNSSLVNGFLVKVYDVFGKQIKNVEHRISNTEFRINLTKQANGIYIVEITTDEFVYREKVVVN